MVYKSLQDGVFGTLTKERQTAIKLLFENQMTDEQIAKSVNRSRQTLAKWKNNPDFKAAQVEYRNIAIDSFVPEVIMHLRKLAFSSKSDMVQLQASQSLLNMAGFGTVNSNVELDKAKVRKANADADMAEYQARIITGKGDIDAPDDGFVDALKKSAEEAWLDGSDET